MSASNLSKKEIKTKVKKKSSSVKLKTVSKKELKSQSDDVLDKNDYDPSNCLDIVELQKGSLKDLHLLAESLSVPDYNFMKKHDLIFSILQHTTEQKGHIFAKGILETLPDGYTSAVSDAQRYKALGNGWTVDVIAHILSNMEREE